MIWAVFLLWVFVGILAWGVANYWLVVFCWVFAIITFMIGWGRLK